MLGKILLIAARCYFVISGSIVWKTEEFYFLKKFNLNTITITIGKPPLGLWKLWMSDSTWALIEMRNNLKSVIEATPVCSHSALESKSTTKNREVKRSTRRDKRSHVEKLAKSAEVAAFGVDVEEYIKINTNTKAEAPVLDLDGNILSTDEE